MTDRILGWTSTMTDTAEMSLKYVGTPLPECDTAWLLDLRPEVPTTTRPPKRVRRAARRAYTTLIGIGLLTITGCTTLGPSGLADVVTQVLR